MIKTIIKRDGSKEQFSPEKLNGWGIWAAETLGQRVNWPEVVLNTVAVLPEKVTSVELQNALIQECINHKSWSYNRMAGRLYAAKLSKDAYGSDQHPHIHDLHKDLVNKGIMSAEFVNAFTDEEYDQINSMLNHQKDFDYAYYQIQQCVNKYSLRDRVSAKKIYETPQYIFMRVAMRLAMNKANRMARIKDFYYFFSNNKINIPTPYFTNSGTNKNGFNSCCVYMTKDHAASLAAGDHIAYTMTYSSAGIGSNIITRTIEDPVRGGVIMHQGKLPYYRALAGAIKANLQNGRGGAATTTYFCYDPEVFKIQRLKNPLTVPSKQIRELDYSMAFNTFFVAKAARNEEVALFSYKDAPDVYDAMVSADDSAFEAVYNKAVKENRHHSFANAREILLNALNEGFEAGRHYLTNLTEMNRHTPFKDPIWLSNLCQEIGLPTKGYNSVGELYQTEYDESQGEVGLCSLAAIVVSNIKDEAEYAKAAYYCLLMIHTAIHESDYELPQVGYTAKARNSAGVGLIGLAHWMAKHKLSYSSQEGRNAIHKLFESHYWHLVNASLKMSEEFGIAKWMHKTKWPDGWTPLDTYNRNIDKIVTVENQYDWKGLSKRIKENGGIHNSVLSCSMPSESSSLSSATTNSIYPIRMLNMLKSNDTDVLSYSAPDSEKLEKYYERAYDIPTRDMKMVYGIVQKWTDQGISADDWKIIAGGNKVESVEILQDFFDSVKYGNKTRYYVNLETAKGIGVNSSEDMQAEESGCEACSI